MFMIASGSFRHYNNMMTDENQTVGFCTSCMQNIGHTRLFASPFFNVFDVLTMRIARRFRLGPWYCFQCERKTIYLQNVKSEYPVFNQQAATNQFQSAHDPEETIAEPVGNYLKRDRSLVMRNKRATRYSDKFRRSTVSRILDGSATLSQICQELEVIEADLIDWIREYTSQLQAQVDDLKIKLDILQSNLPEHLRIADLATSPLNPEGEKENVIDGNILPK